MQQPIQITFRNLTESDPIKKLILDEADELERFFPRLISCRVVIDSPHHHHRKGNLYRVSIQLAVPGKNMVVTRNPSAHFAHSDCYLAIRQAFHEIRRQLQDFTRMRRTPSKVDHHIPLER